MRQLQDFAKKAYTPMGYLFLQDPPEEELPIRDFRTVGNRPVNEPSPNLLDTIYACEERQSWYRDYSEQNGEEPVQLVASLDLEIPVVDAAEALSEGLDFSLNRRTEYSNWTKAFDGLRARAEDAGILVMVNGVVGSNTSRKLDPDEFRGFTLVDELAPVIFVNGADTKAAQIFTLAHELCHVGLGESAISRPDLSQFDGSNMNLRDEVSRTEIWCNQVAAELLVPLESVRNTYNPTADLTDELDRLAKLYKVSTLVVLRRIVDTGAFPQGAYRTAYADELRRVLSYAGSGSSGGNFYYTTPIRVSKRFARALVADTMEGRTSHREAFRLLGSKKVSTFEEIGQCLQDV
ncbi:MAG: ImmA/IrrE family metallo-endopeptidase [Angustibacter sp.]